MLFRSVTTHLDPAHTYAVEAGASKTGSFAPVLTGISIPHPQQKTITVSPAIAAVYRLVPEG